MNRKKILEALKDNADSIESKEKINYLLKKIKENQKLYNEKNRDELREEFYQNGVDISYKRIDKEGKKVIETIHYVMLFRTSAKAKVGTRNFSSMKNYMRMHMIG